MIWLFRCAALFAVLTLTAAAPADLPLEALRQNPEVARTFDYWRLREGRSAEALPALASTIRADDRLVCRSDAELEIVAGLATAATTGSAGQWRADREAAASARIEEQKLEGQALAGARIGQPNADSQIPAYIARARAAKSRRAAELFRRIAADQTGLIVDSPGTPSEGAAERLRLTSQNDYCRASTANTAWLKRQIAQGGWFTISRNGAEADKAAWLMVQHADQDPAFQQQVLASLARLKEKGETSPRNYAFLHDRVAINAGKPQRYGTQAHCVAGKREPLPLEDAANLETLRAQVGLPTLAQYYAYWGPCH